MVTNLPAMQDTQVQSLGWKDPLEEEMAPHSGILNWEVPWTDEPGGLQSMGLQSRHDRATNTSLQMWELRIKVAGNLVMAAEI